MRAPAVALSGSLSQFECLQELGVAAEVTAGGNLQFTVTEDVQHAQRTFGKLQVD